MSAASRVPLLPKGKSRKPSRLTIAPRAKPSTVDRAKRVTTPQAGAESVGEQTARPGDAANKKQTVVTPSVRAGGSDRSLSIETAAPPVIPVIIARKSPVMAPTASATVTPSPAAKRAGGISVGGSLSTSVPPTTIRKPAVAPVTRSPIILPVQRHSDKNGGGSRVERLAKISGAGPVYRTHASPVLGSRAVSSAGNASQDGGNPIAKRMTHKLDIKPHQSPRRATVQFRARHPRTESMSSVTNSPLILAGRAPPAREKEADDTDVLGEGVVGNHTKKNGAVTPSGKRRQTKRRKTEVVAEKSSKQTEGDSEHPRRKTLQRKAKTSPRYRDEQDSEEEPDDDKDEDVNPDELELPEDAASIYVPARERATMWARSLLTNDGEGNENASHNETDTSRALITMEKASASPRGRRKRSNSNTSSINSLVSLSRGSNHKKSELMKKEPSQMTMGELALTIPKGRRMKRHEREEAADSVAMPTGSGDGRSFNLLNMDALKRVRSLSVSSESAALGGSLVTPQVQIIDGKMVILESTIKLGEEQQLHGDDDQFDDVESGIPPRHLGPRLNSSHPNGPGRRWGKEETKQFYYCLSQVGPNFSMMATLFPKRKRKELKSKFKFEEKSHPRLIEIALRASAAPLDSEMVDVIAKMVDKEAQRKLEKQKKRRRSSSYLDEDDEDGDGGEKTHAERQAEPDTLLSPPSRAEVEEEDDEEVEEIVEDGDEYARARRASFDFSG